MKERYEVWIDESDRAIYLENDKGKYCPFSSLYADDFMWFESRYAELARGVFSGYDTPPESSILFGFITPEGLVHWGEVCDN
jgi:hypothetical protein